MIRHIIAVRVRRIICDTRQLIAVCRQSVRHVFAVRSVSQGHVSAVCVWMMQGRNGRHSLSPLLFGSFFRACIMAVYL